MRREAVQAAEAVSSCGRPASFRGEREGMGRIMGDARGRLQRRGEPDRAAWEECGGGEERRRRRARATDGGRRAVAGGRRAVAGHRVCRERRRRGRASAGGERMNLRLVATESCTVSELLLQWRVVVAGESPRGKEELCLSPCKRRCATGRCMSMCVQQRHEPV